MPGRTRLIVNADDFGLSLEINRGVAASHLEGIVTSASLLVRGPAVTDAVARSRDLPRLSLGLHIDLGEWRHRQGAWTAVYEVAALDDADAVAAEIERQVDRFRELVGDDPTHLDSHQHVHRKHPVLSSAQAVARRLSVPLRHFAPGIRYCGDFYGQTGKGAPLPEAIGVAALIRIVAGLPPGVTELGCHPGGAEADGETMYASERATEVQTLCDPRVRAELGERNILLCSFRDLSPRFAGAS
jgi:predicted glycoside hydrolase/deacetylase ChbG (UPF0249 family)